MPLLFSALRGTILNGYNWSSLRKDLGAGIVVGIIAIPLAMALAIATGVPPQFGLITVIIAGIIAALCGGSQFNITGPTAAFVVVLFPIVHRFGFGGLLLSGMMAGVLLVLMGLFRLGRLIHLVPYPVVVGFTAGIGAVIAILQLQDFLGLSALQGADTTLAKLFHILRSLGQIQWPTLALGALTLLIMILWPRLKTPIPPHLIALLLGTLLSVGWNHYFAFLPIQNLGDRFHYTLASGELARGIPSMWPTLVMPWNFGGAEGKPLILTWGLVNQLMGPALVIALLGALESLLCAVVADRMTGTRHSADAELIGQGLANCLVPFFGGIPATAAIARTATNVHSGAKSVFAAVIHSLLVLGAMVILAPYFSWIPMSVLAGLLLVTAWKMSEHKHVRRILNAAPVHDKMVLVVCFTLTLCFDMVIAVTMGLLLSGLLFLRQIARSADVVEESSQNAKAMVGIRIFNWSGSLFFGAAHQVLMSLDEQIAAGDRVIIDFTALRQIDFTGIVALENQVRIWQSMGVQLVFCNLKDSVFQHLSQADFFANHGVHYCSHLAESIELIQGGANNE